MYASDQTSGCTFFVYRNFRVCIRVFPSLALVAADVYGRASVVSRDGIARLYEIPLPGTEQSGDHLVPLIVLRDDNPRTGPRRSVVTAFAEDDGQILPAADYFDSVCMVDRSFTCLLYTSDAADEL